jgi:hypothetical protein
MSTLVSMNTTLKLVATLSLLAHAAGAAALLLRRR